VILTFDLLTLRSLWEAHVTWRTSVPILVFLGLSIFELGPMYATDYTDNTEQTPSGAEGLRPPLGAEA